MVPHSPHALDRIPTLSARMFQTSYIDDGSWPSYDRVSSLSSWLEHRPRLPHSSVDNNIRSSSSVQIPCQMWMENHVQLSAASATVQVLMYYVLDWSCSGLDLLVTNKQGTSLIVVKCMDPPVIAHTHTHARTITLS